MKTALKLIFITVPLIAVGVFILYTIVSNKPAPARSPVAERATAVRVIEAREGRLAPDVIGYGLVRPARVYQAIAQVSGTAEYVNPGLEKGEILPQGTVLVRLSQADFKLAMAQAQANIRAAEAKLAELDISEKNQLAALEIEKKALELKEREYERIRRLADSGTASATALEGAQALLLAQRQKVLNLENALALLPTQRRVQQEQIEVYKANLETARLNLERTTLTLPFTARVAKRAVEVGQFVRSGQVVAELDGVDAAEVESQVAIDDMMALLRASDTTGQAPAIGSAAMTDYLRTLGLDAVVRLHLSGEVLDWPASVSRLSDTIDQKSGTLGVIVRVDTAYSGAEPGSRPPLTKGMFVEVAMSGDPLPGFVIPRSALREGGVLVADEDNRLARVKVTPVLVQDEVVLVREGIAPGMRIIVSAPSPVIEGMLLEVTRDVALEARLAGKEPAQ